MFIVFPKSTAGYKSFLVTALFLDILNANWLPRSLHRALFCITNEVDTSPNKPHLALRLLAEFGNTLPQPPFAQTLSKASHPQQSHEQPCSALPVSRQDFSHQISRSAGLWPAAVDARGIVSAASTSPPSSCVACKFKACSSKIIVFSPQCCYTYCSFPRAAFSCKHFSRAFLDHLWKPASPSYLHCAVSGFLGTPRFVK